MFFNDSGDTDSVIPVTSTRYSIDALKLPTASPWHAWYDDGQVIHFLPFPPSKFIIPLSKILMLRLVRAEIFSTRVKNEHVSTCTNTPICSQPNRA